MTSPQRHGAGAQNDVANVEYSTATINLPSVLVLRCLWVLHSPVAAALWSFNDVNGAGPAPAGSVRMSPTPGGCGAIFQLRVVPLGVREATR